MPVATEEVRELQKKKASEPRLKISLSKDRNSLEIMHSHSKNKRGSLSQSNNPFNSHNYVSYPSIVNMVYFTTVVVLWYIIIRAMQKFKHKLKKDKDTAGFVDYITPRGSQFFGPVAHPLWCAAVMWWSL